MSQTNEPLDHYGRMASLWWQTRHPTERPGPAEATTFFTKVSNAVHQDIVRVQDQIQSDLPADLEYLERVAAIRHTQIQAEELVLATWFPESGRPPRIPEAQSQ